MSISKLASTVILATSFATIFLFAFIFYLFGGKDGALKEVLSMTASFFGGIATLVAAYIATQLFNDWKEQERMVFIRNTAYDSSNLMVQIMQLMQQYPKNNISEIKVLHSKIITNLSFLNRQIRDNEVKMINENFSTFVRKFFDILLLEHDNLPVKLDIKLLISNHIKQFHPELNYIMDLVDIDKVYEKTRKSK